MISRRRVPWQFRNNAPIHCKRPMQQVSVEKKFGAELVVRWQCSICKHIDEVLTREESVVD